MFRKQKRDKMEVCRRHMVAVRLVDALNFAAPDVIQDFKPILAGFDLEILDEDYSPHSRTRRPRLYIRPAGWPKDAIISCFLVSQDGWYILDRGEILTSHLGDWTFDAFDRGGGTDYQARETPLHLSHISQKR